MPKPNEIREHISAIEQTSKITGAMELISSNRMKQVMSHIEYNFKYFRYIRRTMKEILSSSKDVSHPFLSERGRRHFTYMVISGDKGFCGAHNSTVLNYALSLVNRTPGCGLITLGNTAEYFFRSHGIIPDICMLGIVQDPTVNRAREVAQTLIDMYEAELTDEICVIYTSFYGSSKRRPVIQRILPIMLPDYYDIRESEVMDRILYVPSAQDVFNKMIPQYVVGFVFGVLVQAYASEHSARMIAMRSATNNAREMIDKLKASYNIARQQAITNELAEISGAAEVLRPADAVVNGQLTMDNGQFSIIGLEHKDA